jgi:hypothetical protein
MIWDQRENDLGPKSYVEVARLMFVYGSSSKGFNGEVGVPRRDSMERLGVPRRDSMERLLAHII